MFEQKRFDGKDQENINLLHTLIMQIAHKYPNDNLVSTNIVYIQNILRDLGINYKDMQYNYSINE